MAAEPEACAFCAIVRGEADAFEVHRDDSSVAFLDRHPVFLGHVLVVPVIHVATLPDLPGDVLAPFFDAVRRIATAVPVALDAHGTFVAMNNAVSQSVPHLHCHVVPRRRKDGLRGFFWPRTSYASDEAAADVASRVRRAVADLPF